MPFVCIRGFHIFSWAELSWHKLFRKIAAIICCTRSSWLTLTPSQVSFKPHSIRYHHWFLFFFLKKRTSKFVLLTTVKCYSLMFVSVSIFPVFLFSLLHATTYTKKVLDVSIRKWWLLLMTLGQNVWSKKLPIIRGTVVILLFDSLQSMGPNSLMFVRNLLDKLGSNQQNILKFIACNEIFLMPATVFMLFR